MKRCLLVIIPALLLVATAGAFAQDDGDTTVKVTEDPVLGPILTDAEGMTLYLFTEDTTEGESTCYDRCAENWPPFNPEGDLTLPEGVEGELTRIDRTDGTQMVAYNGIPLYYWVNDANPGDTTGQGVGDVWFVVAPGQQFGDPPVMGTAATPEASPVASPVAEGTMVTITLTEFAVEVSQTEFQVGETYTFHVENAGGFPHEAVIELLDAEGQPLEMNGEESRVGPMEPGEMGEFTWTFSEAGDFQIACHVGEHYENGMVTQITVTE